MGLFLLIYHRNRFSIFLLSYPLFYLFFLFFFIGGYRFDRLAVSLMPFFALYSALAAGYLLGKIKASKLNSLIKKVILLVGLLLFLGWPLVHTSLFSLTISGKDTREQAAEWLEKNYPKGKLIFSISDTIHIGQYLQNKGFGQVMNLFPFDNKEIFLYPGEVLLIDSVNYHIAKNYQAIPSYEKFWENYQLIKQKGKLVGEFSQPLFKDEFFSPAFLEHSSTVNAYHNPTVEIYEIPKIEEYANGSVNFEYLPAEMKHNMKLTESNGIKYLFKDYLKEGIIFGPHLLFHKGDYKMEYFFVKPQCYFKDALITIGVAFSGSEQYLAQSQSYCNDLVKYDKLSLKFSLEEPGRLEFILDAGKGVSFLVEKALVGRIGY